MDLLSLLPKRAEPGFTLLETILYLALFGLVIGSITVLGYAVTQNIEKQTAHLETQEQADFVIDKIKWLVDNNAVESPGPDNAAPQLILAGGSGHSQINESAGLLQMQNNNGSPAFLTPHSSKIKNFSVRQDSSHELTIEFLLNDQAFSFSRQLIPGP